MNRRRRGGLRWRITIAFVGGAMGVSVIVAGTTYFLAERYLFGQRIDASLQQSYGSINFALQYLTDPPETAPGLSEQQQSDVTISRLVDLLGTGGAFTSRVDALIVSRDQPFSSSFSIIPALVPPDLSSAVRRGQVGYATIGEPRQLVFGSPIPGQNLDVYFFYPLGDVDETLEILRNVLLVVSAAAIVLAGAIGTRVSRRVVVPVRRVSDAARRVAEGLLETRLPGGGRDELGRLAESFNEMAAALEDRIARERRFVGDVSHELRTPLTTLRTSTEYLLSGAHELPPPLHRATQLLAADLEYLERLVNDLLEISRAESGKVQMAWEPVNLAELTRHVVARRPASSRDRVRILVNTTTDNLMMLGDKKRLERVVGNLVDNALVHGGETDVTVRIARRDGELHLSVEDEGPGVPPEDAVRIFERFFKADRARQRDDGRGSGLGLAIARENAHLHGGDIELDGENGSGARFTVVLPVHDEEPAS